MLDASGEVAYTAKVFPRPISFYTGWMMMLAYFIVCPWEAVAVGRIAGFIFPALNRIELYSVSGKPVYLPHLVIGLGLTALVTAVNYRGIRLSATFQNWTTFGTLALFVIFVTLGVARGSPANFPPLFTHTPLVSILLVLQIVPYFMTGFESVTKSAEEASPEFRARGFSRVIFSAIIVGFIFYIIVIAAVGFVAPWRQLTDAPFMTAVAFEHAVGARWIVSIIMSAALLSLFKVFNGNFVAASRLLFAMARRGLLKDQLATVHPRNQTPSTAVLVTGIATGLCMFLGSAILVPITEVGSVASATGWFAVCAAFLWTRPRTRDFSIALLGALVGLAMVMMKFLPFVPGHFSGWEWLVLGIWIILGSVIGRPRATELEADKSIRTRN
jgi:amino acid transporter